MRAVRGHGRPLGGMQPGPRQGLSCQRRADRRCALRHRMHSHAVTGRTPSTAHSQPLPRRAWLPGGPPADPRAGSAASRPDLA